MSYLLLGVPEMAVSATSFCRAWRTRTLLVSTNKSRAKETRLVILSVVDIVDDDDDDLDGDGQCNGSGDDGGIVLSWWCKVVTVSISSSCHLGTDLDRHVLLQVRNIPEQGTEVFKPQAIQKSAKKCEANVLTSR